MFLTKKCLLKKRSSIRLASYNTFSMVCIKNKGLRIIRSKLSRLLICKMHLLVRLSAPVVRVDTHVVITIWCMSMKDSEACLKKKGAN